MSYGECPEPQDDCKFAPDCFSDIDHLIPQRLAETALEKQYINLPEFKERICRRLHEERNARHASGDESDIPEMPDTEIMARRVIHAHKLGEISLSRQHVKKFKKYD